MLPRTRACACRGRGGGEMCVQHKRWTRQQAPHEYSFYKKSVHANPALLHEDASPARPRQRHTEVYAKGNNGSLPRWYAATTNLCLCHAACIKRGNTYTVSVAIDVPTKHEEPCMITTKKNTWTNAQADAATTAGAAGSTTNSPASWKGRREREVAAQGSLWTFRDSGACTQLTDRRYSLHLCQLTINWSST